MISWREQYWRMERWRQQLDTLKQNRTMGRDAHLEHLRDLFFAFFQACHHMQDWFANDDWYPIPRGELDEYVNASPALAACRDLCNGSKHARLEAKQVNLRDDHKVTAVQGVYAVDNEELAKMVHLEPTLTLEYQGKALDPFDLADQCVAAWNNFIEQHSLNSLLGRIR
jgi:hypothetical protein